MTLSHAPKSLVERRKAGLIQPRRAFALFASLALFAATLRPLCAFESNRVGANLPEEPSRNLLSSAASNNPSQNASSNTTVFQPAMGAVSNWQAEANDNLETKARLEGTVPRCVKLNNYWCIKRARWAGEIAADAEGHVAFATALDGAVAAAMLLRRYYVDYNRRSALAIVSHWAPAKCDGGTVAAGWRSKLRPPGAKALSGLAPHGLQNTLRARWLSTHRRAFTGLARSTAYRSIVPARPIEMLRAPEIAVGMGETQRTPIKMAALDFAAPPIKPGLMLCGGDSLRIQNYASRAIEGIVTSPDADLNLFPPGAMPKTNLQNLLENMAKVEIGPLTVRTDLIVAAIERLATKTPAVGSLWNPSGIKNNETTRRNQSVHEK
jgi:hypothetical protein